MGGRDKSPASLLNSASCSNNVEGKNGYPRLASDLHTKQLLWHICNALTYTHTNPSYAHIKIKNEIIKLEHLVDLVVSLIIVSWLTHVCDV